MSKKELKIVGNYILTKKLGAGAYGNVYLCKIIKEENIPFLVRKRMRRGRRIACKMILLENANKREIEYFLSEINIMLEQNHRNLVRFIEVTRSK